MTDVKRHDEIQGEIIHVYDGIEEADNQLPNWWLLTFYGAIVFAVVYWFAYHELGTLKGPTEVYAAEVARRAAAGGTVDNATLEALAQSSAEVNAGHALFTQYCVSCHGPNAEGATIGPNLTDGFWIHGGNAIDIHTTITNGVNGKGMPPWGPVLGANKVRQLAAYIVSVRGTNRPGKEPQGEPWTPGAGSPN